MEYSGLKTVIDLIALYYDVSPEEILSEIEGSFKDTDCEGLSLEAACILLSHRGSTADSDKRQD